METRDWGMENEDGETSVRSYFRQAYRRMPFLAIATGCVEREELRIEI